MPRIAARILIASASIPFASLLFLIVCSAISQYGSAESRATLAHFAAGMAEWLFLLVVWGVLWGGNVAWNRARIYRLLSASIMLGVLMVAGYIVTGLVYATSSFYSPLPPFVSMAFSGLIPLVWLCITTLILRDTPAEQAARTGGLPALRISCPRCKYHMGPQREAKCPECGTEFTLTELVARQHLTRDLVDGLTARSPD